MPAHFAINKTVDLSKLRGKPFELPDALYLADRQSTAINIAVLDDGEPFSLSGYSVVCWWMYPGNVGQTLIFSGTAAGNVASCVPPNEMFSIPGRGLLTIKLIQGGTIDCTIFSAWINMIRSTTDEQTATGQAIANYDALMPLAEHTQEILDFATDSGWIHIEDAENIVQSGIVTDPTNQQGVMYRKKGNQVTICARGAQNTGIITDESYKVGTLPEGARPMFNQHVLFCHPYASAGVLSNYTDHSTDPFDPHAAGEIPLALIVNKNGTIAVHAGLYPMDRAVKVYPNASQDYTYAAPDFQMGTGIFFNYTFFTN